MKYLPTDYDLYMQEKYNPKPVQPVKHKHRSQTYVWNVTYSDCGACISKTFKSKSNAIDFIHNIKQKGCYGIRLSKVKIK